MVIILLAGAAGLPLLHQGAHQRVVHPVVHVLAGIFNLPRGRIHDTHWTIMNTFSPHNYRKSYLVFFWFLSCLMYTSVIEIIIN